MRPKGRVLGRFAALSGLRKVPGPEASCYPVMIVDARGLPVFFLCEWYRRRKEYDHGRTPETYLEMLLPFAGFLLRHGYAWDAKPEVVRGYLVEFLREDVGCQVRPDRESGDGYLAETTGSSPLSKSSLGVLLAALFSLYETLSAAGYYRYPNPLRSEKLYALKREHLHHIVNAGAPDQAGIRGESQAETRHYPTGFIRQYRGQVWEPQLAMEPDAIQDQMRQAVNWMIQQAPTLRDQVVLQLLRTTGARLSEILSLTVGGYRHAGHTCQALIRNKGSQGREEKRIYFTVGIEQALMMYIRTERAKHDLHRRKRLDQLADTDPLFLTERGTAYQRPAFYHHWYRLLERMQKRYHLAFSPHDLRHLHVTKNLARFKHQAQGNEQYEAELKAGFQQIMMWRSAAMLEVYNKVFKKRQALLEIMVDEDEPSLAGVPVQAEAQRSRPIPSKSSAPPPQPIARAEDHDLSWYEEE